MQERGSIRSCAPCSRKFQKSLKDAKSETVCGHTFDDHQCHLCWSTHKLMHGLGLIGSPMVLKEGVHDHCSRCCHELLYIPPERDCCPVLVSGRPRLTCDGLPPPRHSLTDGPAVHKLHVLAPLCNAYHQHDSKSEAMQRA